MAGRRAQRPAAVRGVEAVSVEDTTIDRAISVVRDAVSDLQTTRSRAVATADLIIGTNRVRHGLGRACIGYAIVASVATLSFAHALNRDNPKPELEVWIDVVGSDMPSAVVEVW